MHLIASPMVLIDKRDQMLVKQDIQKKSNGRLCLNTSSAVILLMQTLQSSETVLLASSNSPPLVLRNPSGVNDDVDIDFGDVFGGPPKRRSKVVVANNNEATRHSFSESALRRRDVISDVGALVTQDEKPVFGEETTSVRRRFTSDDFFDDIFRVNESSSPMMKKEREPFGSSLPGSRILSPALKPESSGTSFPAQFSLPAKATEIPTFGSASTRSLSKNKETVSSSPLSRTSSKADKVSTGKSDSDGCCDDTPRVVVTGKGRQFHFSIYKWPNKGVPVVIWGSSRLSSMSKAEETTTPVTLSGPQSTSSVEKAGKDVEEEGEIGLSNLNEKKKTSKKRPGVQTEEVKTEFDLVSEQAFSGVSTARKATVKSLHSVDSMSEQAFSSVSKAYGATVKPLHSIFKDNNEKQGEEIRPEGEVRKGKGKAKSTRSSTEDSRTKKKPQGMKSSLDSPIPDKSSFASSSATPEVGKDGAKGKVSDFVKIFSQGASVGAGGESLGKSSRWRRAKETPKTDIKHDSANAKETVNVPDQLKKSTSDIPANDRDQKRPEATQEKVSDRESPKNNKARGVNEQEERQEPTTAHTTSEDIDEPFQVNFDVEDITQDENQMEETTNNGEEIQSIDAKIRKWSSGKSGNIRSLLSTLQYILWSGSGWRPVPLMDMIEGNAVRKSYQRALLILHPDKLQQKGASSNQKYMAEKVFELLQEAWDHFNTLGPV
ncbi:PREDICTED: J domain-containing protein required for chloroplast accumulation response 1-like [Camelina sativa]|uniref:J domain-containing protein required for chloroplast accumulation response 1-like n=1 Tax=Camelina sativa TaxID=90675 RepID=A0ABM0SUM1_CAMSA|nr:PREDICTED: J domain-containing protein required for chloroplast accumulation response 1-like [Camelina sativa]XP_019083377.1 PREDICTED: J domain-containing protein required for chloroplast accumulation response 1-like [Camelina sativa]